MGTRVVDLTDKLREASHMLSCFILTSNIMNINLGKLEELQVWLFCYMVVHS